MAIGGFMLLLLVAIAVLAPLLGTGDPNAIAPAKRNREPSAEHWFGTDAFGKDIYARVIYGARISLIVGFSVAILSSIAGLAIGLVSGFIRWADGLIMRVMDGLMSIPLDPARRGADGADAGERRERGHGHHHRRDPARVAAGARRRAVACASSPMWTPRSRRERRRR